MARQGLAAAQHPQLRIAPPAGFNQKLPRRRRRLQNACPRPPQQGQQQVAVPCFLLAGDHDLCAEREWKEKFQCGDVEADRSDRNDGVLRREAGRPAHGAQKVGQRAVRNLHAFRLACRAGGENDVGGVLRTDRRQRRQLGRCPRLGRIVDRNDRHRAQGRRHDSPIARRSQPTPTVR